jgi:hypothetical protein
MSKVSGIEEERGTMKAVVRSNGHPMAVHRLRGGSQACCLSYGLKGRPIIRKEIEAFVYNSRPFVGPSLLGVVRHDKVTVS